MIDLLPGTLVQLHKLSAENDGHLPTGYWLIGRLQSEVHTGRPIEVIRASRSRQTVEEPEVVECLGHFLSSPVRSLIHRDGVVIAATQNSHWEIRPL